MASETKSTPTDGKNALQMAIVTTQCRRTSDWLKLQEKNIFACLLLWYLGEYCYIFSKKKLNVEKCDIFISSVDF